MNPQTLRTTAFTILLILMLAIPAAIMSYKLLVLDYPLAGLIPVTSYHVDVSMQVDGHGGDIELGTYLPKTDSRQLILDVRIMGSSRNGTNLSASTVRQARNVCSWHPCSSVGTQT